MGHFAGDRDKHWPIAMLAVDSGYNTRQVYNWARRHPMSRVIACKGVSTARTLIGTPTAVDVTSRGKRHQRGYKMWPVGVDIAKAELYGWLRLGVVIDGQEPPPGYCHFPEHDAEYFRQLTAEQLVTVTKRNGFTALEWQVIPGRENHWLHCRVYARAAASVLGIDRVVLPTLSRQGQPPRGKVQADERLSRKRSSRAGRAWLDGGRAGGWLGSRR